MYEEIAAKLNEADALAIVYLENRAKAAEAQRDSLNANYDAVRQRAEKAEARVQELETALYKATSSAPLLGRSQSRE